MVDIISLLQLVTNNLRLFELISVRLDRIISTSAFEYGPQRVTMSRSSDSGSQSKESILLGHRAVAEEVVSDFTRLSIGDE
ncbi:hypothetical protein JCM18750_35680 [Halostagnicola bangensis]